MVILPGPYLISTVAVSPLPWLYTYAVIEPGDRSLTTQRCAARPASTAQRSSSDEADSGAGRVVGGSGSYTQLASTPAASANDRNGHRRARGFTDRRISRNVTGRASSPRRPASCWPS